MRSRPWVCVAGMLLVGALAVGALSACADRHHPVRAMRMSAPPPQPPPPPPPETTSAGQEASTPVIPGARPAARRTPPRTGSATPMTAAEVEALAAHEPRAGMAPPAPSFPATDTGSGDSEELVDEEAVANDRALRFLHDANIAFNTPERMNRAETADVVLVLSRKETIDALKAAIGPDVAGGREGAAIQTASRMEAKLTGLGFDIVPTTNPVQAVGSQDRVTWAWQVRPKAVGPQTLTLTLTAKLDKHGVADKTLPPFTRRIEVEVTAAQVVSDFVGRSWQWLWGAILVPLAAAGRAWYSARKRKAQAA